MHKQTNTTSLFLVAITVLSLPGLAAAAEPAHPESNQPKSAELPDASVTSELEEETLRRHAITICGLAIPLMNAYVLNYEYLLGERHGLAVRAEFSPLFDTDALDGTEAAGTLNYRFHLWEGLNSVFIGPYARARYVWGDGTVEGKPFEFEVPEFTVGLNAGYRWMIWEGFNAVFAAGYGYSWGEPEFSVDSAAGERAFDELADDNSEFVDAPFYGEFSVGYAW